MYAAVPAGVHGAGKENRRDLFPDDSVSLQKKSLIVWESEKQSPDEHNTQTAHIVN